MSTSETVKNAARELYADLPALQHVGPQDRERKDVLAYLDKVINQLAHNGGLPLAASLSMIRNEIEAGKHSGMSD